MTQEELRKALKKMFEDSAKIDHHEDYSWSLGYPDYEGMVLKLINQHTEEVITDIEERLADHYKNATIDHIIEQAKEKAGL